MEARNEKQRIKELRELVSSFEYHAVKFKDYQLQAYQEHYLKEIAQIKVANKNEARTLRELIVRVVYAVSKNSKIKNIK